MSPGLIRVLSWDSGALRCQADSADLGSQRRNERQPTHTQVKAQGLLRRQDGPGGRGGAGREGPAPRANAPEGASLQLCAGRRPRILTTNSLSTARERLANNQPADAPSSDRDASLPGRGLMRWRPSVPFCDLGTQCGLAATFRGMRHAATPDPALGAPPRPCVPLKSGH